MSRAQEGAVVDAAKGQNKAYYNNSQNSYSQSQADIGDYQKQLSDYKGQVAKFSASNPYQQGGAFQTDSNRVLANTADAGARSAGQALQSQALRTGQNTAGAIAATEAMQDENTRNLGAGEARAEQERIGAGVGYNREALQADQGLLPATAAPAELESKLSSEEGQLGEGTLGVQQKAAEMPSWMDEFGDAAAKGLGKLVTTGV